MGQERVAGVGDGVEHYLRIERGERKEDREEGEGKGRREGVMDWRMEDGGWRRGRTEMDERVKHEGHPNKKLLCTCSYIHVYTCTFVCHRNK